MRLVIAMMLLMATAAPSGAQRFVRDWNQLSPQEQHHGDHQPHPLDCPPSTAIVWIAS